MIVTNRRKATTRRINAVSMRGDVLTPEQRSYCMSRIRSKDTEPERIVRSVVFGLGYRYRLYDKRLPGKPDLVFKSRKKVIFVHGCFWHMHSCRYGQVTPGTNKEFWEAKRRKTVERDRKNEQSLLANGWTPLVIWECEIKDMGALGENVRRFLK